MIVKAPAAKRLPNFMECNTRIFSKARGEYS
jgi:hypothetical protein